MKDTVYWAMIRTMNADNPMARLLPVDLTRFSDIRPRPGPSVDPDITVEPVLRALDSANMEVPRYLTPMTPLEKIA
jgi:hypothetical protein